jgi:hypothetical protein
VRVRTVNHRLGWGAIIGFLAYGAVVVGASFLETRQLVDQAVFEADRRPRAAGAAGQASDSTLLEIAVDAREAILVAARRNNLPIDASKLTVKPEGSGIRVSSSSTPARPRWPFRSGWTVRSSSDPDRGLITGEPCHGHCRMELSPERLTDLRENARVPRQARDQSGEAGRREEADDQGRAGPLGARQRG